MEVLEALKTRRSVRGYDPEHMPRIINDIARATDLSDLTVAEPMPRTAILLSDMLRQLPLMK